jgi:hypothetical protein
MASTSSFDCFGCPLSLPLSNVRNHYPVVLIVAIRSVPVTSVVSHATIEKYLDARKGPQPNRQGRSAVVCERGD